MEIKSTADIDVMITPANHPRWVAWIKDQHTRLGTDRICRITGASPNEVYRWTNGETIPRYQKLGIHIYITIDNQER